MGDWKPDRQISYGGIGIFLWIIPAKVGGTWYWETEQGRHYQVRLHQTYQRVGGEAWIDGEPVPLEQAVLWGDWLELVLRPNGASEPESVFMRCGRDHWVGFSGEHKGVLAHRQRG